MYKENFEAKLEAFDADMVKETDTSNIDVSNTIKQLARLNKIEYDRERLTQAKMLGIRPSTLDGLVKNENASAKQDDGPFSNTEPSHESVNPKQLLDEITNLIQLFIVLDTPQAKVTALWIAASWFVDVIHCAPILLINAPEKACGKTQLLTVIGRLVPRSVQASGISPSVLFRMVEKYQPTLLIDEIETVLKDNEELRGLINAGHTRDSAFIWRSVAQGDDFEPKRFSVWGMKAIAGINSVKLAETVTSRSIVVHLRRKTNDETVQRLRNAEEGLFESLKSKLARFQNDYSISIRKIKPELPNWLSDRDQDNFEPLLQIATIAGTSWLEDTYKCAKELTANSEDNKSVGNELLRDIKEILEIKSWIKISLADLLSELCSDDERAWSTYNRGNSITPRQLSKKLSDYGISTKTIRTNDSKTAKGYESEQFIDAFERYLSSSQQTSDFSNKPANTKLGLDESVTTNVTNPKPTSNINHLVTSSVTKNINEINSLIENVTKGSVSITEAHETNSPNRFVSF